MGQPGAHSRLLGAPQATRYADLQAKGLLGQTLVVEGTEFGRTSRINDKGGPGKGSRWDTRSDNFERDPATSCGQGQGAAGPTLVVLATEFGRAPRMYGNDGREHYDRAFTCLLAGAGSRAGVADGDTHTDNFEGPQSRQRSQIRR